MTFFSFFLAASFRDVPSHEYIAEKKKKIPEYVIVVTHDSHPSEALHLMHE